MCSQNMSKIDQTGLLGTAGTCACPGRPVTKPLPHAPLTHVFLSLSTQLWLRACMRASLSSVVSHCAYSGRRSSAASVRRLATPTYTCARRHANFVVLLHHAYCLRSRICCRSGASQLLQSKV